LASYVEDQGDKRYRRGLYHFIKRTVPPPSMLIFDASNRDQCEVKRSSTNTPLQSLVLMNDYQVLEAARHLAIKTQKDQIKHLKPNSSNYSEKSSVEHPNPMKSKKLKIFTKTT
jgi:hypothetical protein